MPLPPQPSPLTVRVGPAPALPHRVAWARSLHLSVPQFPPLESPRAWKSGRCDLGSSGASRGSSQTWGSFLLPREGKPFSFNIVGGKLWWPPAEEQPQEGTRGGIVLLPGVLKLGFVWVAGRVWISLVPASLSQRRQQPQGQLVFVYCTETCVGALVKNVNGSAPLSVWGWESGSLDPDPKCVVGGHLTPTY